MIRQILVKLVVVVLCAMFLSTCKQLLMRLFPTNSEAIDSTGSALIFIGGIVFSLASRKMKK